MIRENLDILAGERDTAILSSDGLHRFRLDRGVADKGPRYAFIGVNPSTADASVDDATVRKWRGFVKRWGGSSFSVVNLFTWRATDVRELKTCPEPNRHDESERHMKAVLDRADIIVPCWGRLAKLDAYKRPRAATVMGRLQFYGKPVMHMGLTKCGNPKHPLMLGYDTPLTQLFI